MKKKAWTLFLIVSLAGFVSIYNFWPNDNKLPILDSVASFELEEAHGEDYNINNDKIKLIAFFYTHCPDICPLTMHDFKKLQAQLQKEGVFGEKVELVAITLDPKNDTLEVIKNYSSSFNADPSGWKWLRGTEEETKEIANSLKMQYQQLDGDFFAHSTTMYLLDEQNNLRALYDMAYTDNPVDIEQILKDIYLIIDNL